MLLCCSVCLFLYGAFCHVAHKLDISTLITTFFSLTSLEFIFVFYFVLKIVGAVDKCSTRFAEGRCFKTFLLMFIFLAFALYEYDNLGVIFIKSEHKIVLKPKLKRGDPLSVPVIIKS